tara:strand:+ start:896 stop:2491 length:1596 start_codon:yes stop_codon:yes gene_type:complete
MKLLFESWRRYLDEITRADKEGVKLPSGQEELSKYVADPPTHYIQFSDINKLGINPSSQFKTPVGIYSYPLTTDLFIQFVKGRLPFAQERLFVIAFKPTDTSKIIFNNNEGGATDHNRSGVSVKEFWQYVRRLLDSDSVFANEVRKDSSEESEENVRRNPYLIRRYEKLGLTPIPDDLHNVIFSPTFWRALESTASDSRYTSGYLWRLTQLASDKDPQVWRSTLVNLGIEGWVDLNGAGIVHDAEPTQGVFFSKSFIEMSEVFRNPTKGSTVKIRNLYLPVFKAARLLIPKILKETGLDRFISANEVASSISPGAKKDPGGGMGASFWSKLRREWGVAEGGAIPKEGQQLIRDLQNDEPWAEEQLRATLLEYVIERWFRSGNVFLNVLMKNPALENRDRDVGTKLKEAGWALRNELLPRRAVRRARDGGTVSTADLYDLAKINNSLKDWVAEAEAQKDGRGQYAGLTQFVPLAAWAEQAHESAPWFLGGQTSDQSAQMGQKLIKMFGGPGMTDTSAGSFWGNPDEYEKFTK